MLKHLKSLAQLLYPELCISCMKNEPVYDELLCHYCWKEIPRFADIGENKELLKKRFPLMYQDDVSFYGLYLFSKKGFVQNILHQIKYNGRSHIAIKLGSHLAKQIPKHRYDAMIPVPMHYKKMRRRGYNQALMLSKGISEITGIPILRNILEKSIDTDSQTKMDRITRHANVLKSYRLQKNLHKEIENVLLIDDVITTGATLEVCTNLLKEKHDINIDYAFIAMAIAS